MGTSKKTIITTCIDLWGRLYAMASTSEGIILERWENLVCNIAPYTRPGSFFNRYSVSSTCPYAVDTSCQWGSIMIWKCNVRENTPVFLSPAIPCTRFDSRHYLVDGLHYRIWHLICANLFDAFDIKMIIKDTLKFTRSEKLYKLFK